MKNNSKIKLTKESIKFLYKDLLKNSKENGKITLGLIKETNDLYEKNMMNSPNVLFVGDSKISISALSTSVISFIKNHEKKTCFIIGNSLANFQPLKKVPNIYIQKKLDYKSIKITIDLIYQELKTREHHFFNVKTTGYEDYEKICGSKINKCLLVIENLEEILKILKFNEDFSTKESATNKLIYILRVGRSKGVWVFSNTSEILPSSISPSFTNKLVFKTSNKISQEYLGNMDAAEISEEFQCLTEDGLVCFPDYSNEELERILGINLFYKKADFDTPFFYLTDDILKTFNKNYLNY